MVIRRKPVSLTLYAFIAIAAGLSVLWWATGGPFARSAHDAVGAFPSNGAGASAVSATDKAVSDLQTKLKQTPNYADGYAQLGGAYLQKARETADPSYYAKADEVLQASRRLDPNNAGALIGVASLDLSRHLFREALQVAEQAKALNPYNAGVYGEIGDAHIELGEYDEAIAAFQQMVNLKPDLSAYSRVSYARELNGDHDGALVAMLEAIKHGSPGTEGTAWTRVQAGNLYFNQGDFASAERQYRQSMFDFKDYPHGMAGLAMVDVAKGKYTEAIALYQQVTKIVPLPQYVIALGDVQQAAGKKADAARTYELVGVEEQLFEANGVDSGLEIALFNVDHGRNLSAVLNQAREAQQRRPSVLGDDVLAWTQFKTGDINGARDTMQHALRLGTKIPLMLYHAAAIEYAAGDHKAARQYLEQLNSSNPHFSVLYEADAARLLAQLRKEPGTSGS